jgi:hypothetical protein
VSKSKTGSHVEDLPRQPELLSEQDAREARGGFFHFVTPAFVQALQTQAAYERAQAIGPDPYFLD